MPIYDLTDLEEAMNALKEEMMNDLSESLIRDKPTKDTLIDALELK